MQTQLMQMRTTWGRLPRRAQLAILGVGVVTVLVLFLVLRAATTTTWAPVTSELSPEKTGQAETALEEAGIEHRMSEAGSAIEVPEEMKSKAAATLMTAGIAAKGGRADCAKQFSEGNGMLAQTSAQHAVKLETCQESQAANDIEQIEGISNASVDATLVAKTVFKEDQTEAKAAVRIDTDGASLPAKTIKGIQQTVASRFDTLKPTAVSIIDETGSEVSQSSTDDAAARDALKLEAEAKYNGEAERKLTESIEKVVGEGNVVVSSNVELDMDDITREVLNSKPAGEDGEQLVEVEDYARELLNGDPAAATEGVAGTATNQTDPDNRTVTPDIDTDGDGEADYVSNEAKVTYANNKVAEAIGVAKGTVIRFRMSVVVDDNVDEAAATAVKDSVQAWMGGNAQDSFSFHQAPIAAAKKGEAVASSGTASAIAGYLKWALLGLGLIGLAFVLRRSLTQRTAELLAPADDLLMLEPGDFTPIPIAELEAALAAGQPDAERTARIEMQRKVEQIAESKPHDVANELRRWMHQDEQAYAAAPRRAS